LSGSDTTSRAWRAVIGASAALLLAAAAAAGPAQEKVLRRGNGAEPQSLDLHKAEDVSSANILRDLYEGLTGAAPDGTIVPAAATQWTVSADGRRYRFALRADALWSNGDAVTAMDFVAGMRRAVDPATGSKYAHFLDPILNARAVIDGRAPVDTLGVRAVDAHALEIDLEHVTPYFPSLLTHSMTFPIHRPSLEKYGERYTRPGRLVSNGAYMLSEWVVQSHITLVRNPHYHDASSVPIDRVEFLPISDAGAELSRFRAGGLDWTDTVPLTQLGWIREHMPGDLHVDPYLGTYYYAFNLTQPPFKDNPALRAALSMAVDREALTAHITGAGEQPAFSLVPPGVQHYGMQPLGYAALPPAGRIAEARRLYREAGYGPGRPLEVELRYNTSDNHKRIAVAIAAMWKQVLGVRTQLLNEEWKVFLQNRKQRTITQVFRSGWIGDYNDAYTFLDLFESNNGRNDSGYVNPRFDALLERAQAEQDAAERRGLLEQAERILLADHAIIPLYYYVSKHMIKPYVSGYVPNILDYHYTRHLDIRPH